MVADPGLEESRMAMRKANRAIKAVVCGEADGFPLPAMRAALPNLEVIEMLFEGMLIDNV